MPTCMKCGNASGWCLRKKNEKIARQKENAHEKSPEHHDAGPETYTRDNSHKTAAGILSVF